MYASANKGVHAVLHYLAVATDGERAAFAAIGKQVLVTLCAVLRVFFHYVLFPQQRVFAVMTVEMLTARHSDFDLFSYRSKKKSCTKERAENRKSRKSYLLLPLIRKESCIKTGLPLLIQGEAEARTAVQTGTRQD